MKALALYLPQFHEVSENNTWWGEGFTEWTNVRSATPLFDGHRQPLEPLDDHYYDLTNSDELVWQSALANRYDVGGFVFFHYWYTGKLLLEKPVELYRETPQAATDYCFCWANHPWTRAWDGKEHQILQPQTYGGREDWIAHFEYLLPFFQDHRYIKRDGLPVFFLYNAGAIPQVDSMIALWNEMLQAHGFPGLYLVEVINSRNTKAVCMNSQAVFEDEPMFTLRFEIPLWAKALRALHKKTLVTEYQDYDQVWRLILKKRRLYGGRAIIRGAFTSWDNSPRRGAKGATIVRESSAEKFGRYVHALLRQHREDVSTDFLVVNAWNEWGEGALLEPTKRDGLAYLEALKSALQN